MNAPVIDARRVAVNYVSGPIWDQHVTHAVKEATLEIAAGETVGLVGESGSGKTTLGRLFLGLVGATSGAVLFDGQAIGPRQRPPAGKLSVVLQNPEWALNPRLTVGTSVCEPVSVLGTMTRKQRQVEARRVLELVGLDRSFVDRYPHELSGGQRQRVAIARALITEPRFIVFDEAASALDVSVQTQVLNLIKDLQEKHGFGALFISHDLAATRYLSHRMAVMYAGVLMEVGPVKLFYGKAQHPYSRALSISIDEKSNASFALKGISTEVADEGCPLHLRCPWSIERCRRDRPQLRDVDRSKVACHRAEDVASA
jgi:oligopeptide/dipeptide ABC transporter ATP-binding protein